MYASILFNLSFVHRRPIQVAVSIGAGKFLGFDVPKLGVELVTGFPECRQEAD